MKSYLIYAIDSGVIRQKRVAPMLYAQDVPVGCWAIEGDCDIRLHRVDVSVNPFNPPIVPLPQPEPEPIPPPTSHEINAVRDRLEQAPLTVDGVRWDYDTLARERMLRAIAHWNVLTHTRVGDRIGWKDADNQVHLLTLADLVALQDALEEASAVRADALHAYARGLGERLPNLTHAALDPSGWPVG